MNKWIEIERRIDGAAWTNKALGLVVIESTATEKDGKKWYHVSLSRKSRLPSYDDMKVVKDHFIGKHNHAIQVFAPESEHVNLHSYCLHLWHCLEGSPLPDFTQGTGSI